MISTIYHGIGWPKRRDNFWCKKCVAFREGWPGGKTKRFKSGFTIMYLDCGHSIQKREKGEY